MVTTLSSYMLLKVITLSGEELEIDVDNSDKIKNVKERIEEREGIPPVQQRLIYQGKQMNDDKTIANYKIKGGATLHLVVALRGG